LLRDPLDLIQIELSPIDDHNSILTQASDYRSMPTVGAQARLASSPLIIKMTLPLRSLYAEKAKSDGASGTSTFSPDQPLMLPTYVRPVFSHSFHHVNPSVRTQPSSLNLKPSEEELAALRSIERLGDKVDQDLAIEFLRGSQFGDQSSSTSTAADRSLPSAAVATLKLWFLAHQNDPYPSKADKDRLMKETGLSLIQLKNWFSNIRKRHWHPIRTGSRRPRSHVEYVLLMGATKHKRIMEHQRRTEPELDLMDEEAVLDAGEKQIRYSHESASTSSLSDFE
jgi:hypothetical protein